MRKLLLIITCVGFTIALSAQKKQAYSIGILLDKKSERLEPLLLQLQEQIKGVIGEDAEIIFREENILADNFSLEQARQNYAQLLANNTDIILAFGAANNVIIYEQNNYPKPTILFGAINKDLINVDLDKTTSGINNFTYLIESESYQDDLKKLKELTDFKNLGIIVEQQVLDILPLKETFDQQLGALDANYQLIPFSTIADITTNLNEVDAIYLPGGLFLTQEEVNQLSKAFIDNKLPAFTATGIEDVKAGFFATNRGEDNINQFQRRIALNVEAYVNGTNLSELPVFIQVNHRLTINYNTAELVGVPIKYSLIATTDFVGDLKNSLSEENYDLLSAISQVLGQNLALAADKKELDLIEQDILLAKSNYLPSVVADVSGAYVDKDLAEVSFGQNPEFSTSGAVTAQQLVYSKAVNTNIDIQKELLKAQEATFNSTQLDAIYDVSNAYLNTLIAKANAQIQIRNLELTKKNLQLAEQKFDAGESGKSDVLRFTSESAQNMQVMIQSINRMEQSFIELNRILNNPLDKEIDVEDVEMDKGLLERYNYDELTRFLDDPKLREPFTRFLVEEAIKNAPELRGLDYNLKANEHTLELYGRGRYLPTVSMQAQYNQIINRSGAGSESTIPKGNYNVGANVSLPLFNQNLNNINQQTAVIQKDQLNINKENLTLNISANVRNSVFNVVNQVSNIELSKIAVSTAAEALELTQTAYSSGAVNIIGLIDAQNNYLNAELERTNAVYNFLIASLQLERSIGYFFLLNSEADNAEFRQRFLTFSSN